LQSPVPTYYNVEIVWDIIAHLFKDNSMEQALPKAFTDLLPPAVREYALYIALGSICAVGVVGLLLLVIIARFLFGRGKGKASGAPNLEEDLRTYPDLKTTSSGDRQLRVEGVPVRLRLVVIAPAGTASEVDADELPDFLEKIIPGLGDIYKHDNRASRSGRSR
jgi:hypothetical protein